MMWWSAKREDNINPNYAEILYGYKPETNSFYAFNQNYNKILERDWLSAARFEH